MAHHGFKAAASPSRPWLSLADEAAPSPLATVAAELRKPGTAHKRTGGLADIASPSRRAASADRSSAAVALPSVVSYSHNASIDVDSSWANGRDVHDQRLQSPTPKPSSASAPGTRSGSPSGTAASPSIAFLRPALPPVSLLSPSAVLGASAASLPSAAVASMGVTLHPAASASAAASSSSTSAGRGLVSPVPRTHSLLKEPPITASTPPLPRGMRLVRLTPSTGAAAASAASLTAFGDRGQTSTFLTNFKRLKMQEGAARRLQAWWKGQRAWRKLWMWRARRRARKREVLEAWRAVVLGEKYYRRVVVRRCFRAWKEELEDTKNMRLVVRALHDKLLFAQGSSAGLGHRLAMRLVLSDKGTEQEWIGALQPTPAPVQPVEEEEDGNEEEGAAEQAEGTAASSAAAAADTPRPPRRSELLKRLRACHLIPGLAVRSSTLRAMIIQRIYAANAARERAAAAAARAAAAAAAVSARGGAGGVAAAAAAAVEVEVEEDTSALAAALSRPGASAYEVFHEVATSLIQRHMGGHSSTQARAAQITRGLGDFALVEMGRASAPTAGAVTASATAASTHALELELADTASAGGGSGGTFGSRMAAQRDAGPGLLSMVEFRLKRAFFDALLAEQRAKNKRWNAAKDKLMRIASHLMAHDGMWLSQLQLIVLRMWFRWARYHRCKRLRIQPPSFHSDTRPLPQWDKFMLKQAQKQMRKATAGMMYGKALVKRLWRRWRAYVEVSLHHKGRIQRAVRLCNMNLIRRCFRSMKIARVVRRIAMRPARNAMGAWREWAANHKQNGQTGKAVAARVKQRHMSDTLHRWRVAWRAQQMLQAYSTALLQGAALGTGAAGAGDRDAVVTAARGAGGRGSAGQLLALQACLYMVGDPGSQSALVSAWKDWSSLVARRRMWRKVLFVYRRETSRHLVRTVFAAWKMVAAENKAARDARFARHARWSRYQLRLQWDVEQWFATVAALDKGAAAEDATDAAHLRDALLEPTLMPLDSSAARLLAAAAAAASGHHHGSVPGSVIGSTAASVNGDGEGDRDREDEGGGHGGGHGYGEGDGAAAEDHAPLPPPPEDLEEDTFGGRSSMLSSEPAPAPAPAPFAPEPAAPGAGAGAAMAARRGRRRSSIVALEGYTASLAAAAAARRSTPLHVAVDHCDEDGVRSLLAGGADPNAQDTDGCTPLHIACKHYSAQFLGIIVVLIECGAKIGMRDAAGRTAVDVAVNPDAIRLLQAHHTRLTTGGFTSYERQQYRARCVSLWADMHHGSMWGLLTEQLFAARKGRPLCWDASELRRLRGGGAAAEGEGEGAALATADAADTSNSADVAAAAADPSTPLSPPPPLGSKAMRHRDALAAAAQLVMVQQGGAGGRGKALALMSPLARAEVIAAAGRRMDRLAAAVDWLRDNNAVDMSGLQALQARQEQESKRRRRLAAFAADRAQLLLTNATMRQNLAQFTAVNAGADASGKPIAADEGAVTQYRDATAKALALARKRDLVQAAGYTGEDLEFLERMIAGFRRSGNTELQLVTARAKAGVDVVVRPTDAPPLQPRALLAAAAISPPPATPAAAAATPAAAAAATPTDGKRAASPDKRSRAVTPSATATPGGRGGAAAGKSPKPGAKGAVKIVEPAAVAEPAGPSQAELDSALVEAATSKLQRQMARAAAALGGKGSGSSGAGAGGARRGSMADMIAGVMINQRKQTRKGARALVGGTAGGEDGSGDAVAALLSDCANKPSASLALRVAAAEAQRAALQATNTYAALGFTSGDPEVDAATRLYGWDLVRARLGLGYWVTTTRDGGPRLPYGTQPSRDEAAARAARRAAAEEDPARGPGVDADRARERVAVSKRLGKDKDGKARFGVGSVAQEQVTQIDADGKQRISEAEARRIAREMAVAETVGMRAGGVYDEFATGFTLATAAAPVAVLEAKALQGVLPAVGVGAAAASNGGAGKAAAAAPTGAAEPAALQQVLSSMASIQQEDEARRKAAAEGYRALRRASLSIQITHSLATAAASHPHPQAATAAAAAADATPGGGAGGSATSATPVLGVASNRRMSTSMEAAALAQELRKRDAARALAATAVAGERERLVDSIRTGAHVEDETAHLDTLLEAKKTARAAAAVATPGSALSQVDTPAAAQPGEAGSAASGPSPSPTPASDTADDVHTEAHHTQPVPTLNLSHVMPEAEAAAPAPEPAAEPAPDPPAPSAVERLVTARAAKRVRIAAAAAEARKEAAALAARVAGIEEDKKDIEAKQTKLAEELGRAVDQLERLQGELANVHSAQKGPLIKLDKERQHAKATGTEALYAKRDTLLSSVKNQSAKLKSEEEALQAACKELAAAYSTGQPAEALELRRREAELSVQSLRESLSAARDRLRDTEAAIIVKVKAGNATVGMAVEDTELLRLQESAVATAVAAARDTVNKLLLRQSALGAQLLEVLRALPEVRRAADTADNHASVLAGESQRLETFLSATPEEQAQMLEVMLTCRAAEQQALAEAVSRQLAAEETARVEAEATTARKRAATAERQAQATARRAALQSARSARDGSGGGGDGSGSGSPGRDGIGADATAGGLPGGPSTRNLLSLLHQSLQGLTDVHTDLVEGTSGLRIKVPDEEGADEGGSNTATATAAATATGTAAVTARAAASAGPRSTSPGSGSTSATTGAATGRAATATAATTATASAAATSGGGSGGGAPAATTATIPPRMRRRSVLLQGLLADEADADAADVLAAAGVATLPPDMAASYAAAAARAAGGAGGAGPAATTRSGPPAAPGRAVSFKHIHPKQTRRMSLSDDVLTGSFVVQVPVTQPSPSPFGTP